MKKLFILSLIVLCYSTIQAQFTLHGRIQNYASGKSLNVNIPLVFGFRSENSQIISVADDGSFQYTFPILEQKSATIQYNKLIFQTLLLNPGEDLELVLTDSTIRFIGGTARAENELLQRINPDPVPFFMKAPALAGFAKFSFSQLQENLLKPYFSDSNRMNALIDGSLFSPEQKQFIRMEFNAQKYNQLNDFVRECDLPKSTADSLILHIFDDADLSLRASAGGPSYYTFVDNYVRYLEKKAFAKIKAEKIPSGKLIPYFGISLDSANRLMDIYSKDYWRLIGVANNFPSNIAAEYNYQQLVNLYQDKDLKHLEALARAHFSRFPTARHNPTIQSYIAELKSALVKNKQNKNIQIFADYERVGSMNEVIATLKGKVVYLDVWGTWCGPCKAELKYTPELKKKYADADKDIAFVYLDMDADNKDQDWKDFIRINNLTGIHLRKNREQMDSFWKELLRNAKDKAEYYPQYFIFDKTGKLVVEKALRPSHGQQLYDQLDKILNQ